MSEHFPNFNKFKANVNIIDTDMFEALPAKVQEAINGAFDILEPPDDEARAFYISLSFEQDLNFNILNRQGCLFHKRLQEITNCLF